MNNKTNNTNIGNNKNEKTTKPNRDIDYNAKLKQKQIKEQQKKMRSIKEQNETQFNIKSSIDQKPKSANANVKISKVKHKKKASLDDKSKKQPDLNNKMINIKINGHFPLTGHTLEIFGFAAKNKEHYLHPFITDAYLVIKDKNGKIIRTILGTLDGLNSVHKQIIFSIKCDPETTHSLDSIGLMVLYNKRNKFNGKMYQLNESKVLAMAHKNNGADAGQMETLHQTRNKRYIPFEASIDESLTTIIVPDYDKTAINIETLTQALKG